MPSTHAVTIVRCGTAQHAADVAALRLRHRAVPHDYSSWPRHCSVGSWRWCRIANPKGELITGFSVHLTNSRALPHTRIGRIEHMGRNLHEEVSDSMGDILIEVANRIPRLLRLDVRIFDEDPVRRCRLQSSLAAAGWTQLEHQREYTHTVVLPLRSSEAEVRKAFSTRLRSAMRKALETPLLRYGPIGVEYAGRMDDLHEATFERTGGSPPRLDARAILRDSSDGQGSQLVGAFATDRSSPEDLVAFAWTRLHGDYAVLQVTASERSALFRKHISPGFGLMAHQVAWAIARGAAWMDLGGLPTTNPEPSDPMRGVVEFKTRFSMDFREVATEWRLEPHPLLARTAAAVRSIRDFCEPRHAQLAKP
jgi:hypothetical protein